MDESNEGILLIGTSMILLVVFLTTVFAVMLIYRKRKIQHEQEISHMNMKFEKELLQTQLETQQQTMHHIGREIHDNVGHQLTLAFLYSQQIESEDQNVTHLIEEMATIIDQSLQDLRSLSASLIKNQLNESIRLHEMIEDECNQVMSGNFCQVKYDVEPISMGVSPETCSFILRILQEFLQNSLKHSRCEKIEVDLKLSGDKVLLAASDDGIGFDINQNASSGIGLQNMRRRAEMINAHFELTSEPGYGAKLKLEIPVSLKVAKS